jgi:hypothetical protein
LTTVSPGSATQVSVPVPPSTESLPETPSLLLSVSFPARPDRLSAPALRRTCSLRRPPPACRRASRRARLRRRFPSERVAAGAAGERVRRRIAGERVVAGAARHLLHVEADVVALARLAVVRDAVEASGFTAPSSQRKTASERLNVIRRGAATMPPQTPLPPDRPTT